MSNIILYRVWLETETEGSMQRVYHDSWITQDAAERAVKRLNSALRLEGLSGKYVVEFSDWGKRKEVSRRRPLGNVCCSAI